MSAKLLSCPFCGAPPEIEPWHGGPRTKRLISCQNEECPVEPIVSGDTAKEATDRWNTRSVNAALDFLAHHRALVGQKNEEKKQP